MATDSHDLYDDVTMMAMMMLLYIDDVLFKAPIDEPAGARNRCVSRCPCINSVAKPYTASCRSRRTCVQARPNMGIGSSHLHSVFEKTPSAKHVIINAFDHAIIVLRRCILSDFVAMDNHIEIVSCWFGFQSYKCYHTTMTENRISGTQAV